jgi:hypothetical protein
VLEHHVTAGDAGKRLSAELPVKDAFARQLEDQSWLVGYASTLQVPQCFRSPLRGSSRARLILRRPGVVDGLGALQLQARG